MSDSVTTRKEGTKDVDLLRHVEMLVETQKESVRSLEEMLHASVKTITDLMENNWSHHKEMHEAIEMAIQKAEAVMVTYKADSNEWRATVNDLVVRLPTMKDLDAVKLSVDTLREGITAQQRQTQSEWMLWRETIEKRLSTADQSYAVRNSRQDAVPDAIKWAVAVIGGILGIGALLYALFGGK